MNREEPIVKLAGHRSQLYLYADRLVERRDWPFTTRVHRLVPGMEANVDGVGLGNGGTPSNWGCLTITSPELVLTRTLRGSESISLGARFAAHLNEAVRALDTRHRSRISGSGD